MLIRILSDNPGPSFTRNFDPVFVNTVKNLLRGSRDLGVQQLLRETLESLAIEKASDANLAPLLAMWMREKEKFDKQQRVSTAVQFHLRTPHYFVPPCLCVCPLNISRPNHLRHSRTSTPANKDQRVFRPRMNSRTG